MHVMCVDVCACDVCGCVHVMCVDVCGCVHVMCVCGCMVCGCVDVCPGVCGCCLKDRQHIEIDHIVLRSTTLR